MEKISRKSEVLQSLRIKIEILKHLVRMEHEIKIISDKQYLMIEAGLQEISKEASGWERYITSNSPKRELL